MLVVSSVQLTEVDDVVLLLLAVNVGLVDGLVDGDVDVVVAMVVVDDKAVAVEVSS